MGHVGTTGGPLSLVFLGLVGSQRPLGPLVRPLPVAVDALDVAAEEDRGAASGRTTPIPARRGRHRPCRGGRHSGSGFCAHNH